MVHVDSGVALAGQVQTEAAVDLEQVQHVVQKRIAGINDAPAGLVQIEA